MESIGRLREICQQTRGDIFYQEDWLTRNVFRRVSIYPTKFFLKAGLSPNQVTLLSLLPGIAAGALLTLPQSEYWLWAWGVLLLYWTMDCCDGEMARYQGSSSLVGEYNDTLAGIFFLRPLLRACMCFGIYQALGNIIVFVFGFALIIGGIVYYSSPYLCQTFLGRKGILQEQLEGIERLEFSPTLSRRIAQYGQKLFANTGFFYALPTIALLDMITSPFSIGSLDLNVRFIYFASFALVVVFASVATVYDVNRYGVRPSK